MKSAKKQDLLDFYLKIIFKNVVLLSTLNYQKNIFRTNEPEFKDSKNAF